MRDYKVEFEARVAFVKELIKTSGADGIIYGNSGGKDCSLVGIICKAACENTEGVLMPCSSKRNFEEDTRDGLEVADQFGIKTRNIDLTELKDSFMDKLADLTELSDMAKANIPPRLRMISLYAIAASENRLVAGTGNKSEAYMGYFTKWGDGAHDFNVIADLTVTEIYEFLAYLDAPMAVRTKSPSAALFEGQTDEDEMGVTYKEIDEYIADGSGSEKSIEIIKGYHSRSEHKRNLPITFKG